MAMAVHDFVSTGAAPDLRAEHFPIFATDISNKALAAAREGRYHLHQINRGLPRELLLRYFRQSGNAWTIHDDLRRHIEFRRLNLIDQLVNLGPFEVIFCRNVLIYFDQQTRQRLCDQFHNLLAPGGLLIIGAAENLYGINGPFISEQLGTTTAYRKPLAAASAE